jgi:hypothetical protein
MLLVRVASVKCVWQMCQCEVGLFCLVVWITKASRLAWLLYL